jgi:hypothetical protein
MGLLVLYGVNAVKPGLHVITALMVLQGIRCVIDPRCRCPIRNRGGVAGLPLETQPGYGRQVEARTFCPMQVAAAAPRTSKWQTLALLFLWLQSPYCRKGRADDFGQATLFHHLHCLDGVYPTPLALLFLQPFIHLVVNR